MDASNDPPTPEAKGNVTTAASSQSGSPSPSRMTAQGPRRIIGWAGVVFMLGSGLWAFVAPRSFYDTIATFEPYNRHFIHDIGAFTIGLGAVLLFALVTRWDALQVALAGLAVASVMHLISHAVDADLGGRDSRPARLGRGRSAVRDRSSQPPVRSWTQAAYMNLAVKAEPTRDVFPARCQRHADRLHQAPVWPQVVTPLQPCAVRPRRHPLRCGTPIPARRPTPTARRRRPRRAHLLLRPRLTVRNS